MVLPILLVSISGSQTFTSLACCKLSHSESFSFPPVFIFSLLLCKLGKFSTQNQTFTTVKASISMLLLRMRRGKSFKESIKILEADIQHANTLAFEFPRDLDGACVQMRLSYSPAAKIFLFLVSWTDCRLAGMLGLLRILIYQVYNDGTTTMSTYERKSSLQEFYAYILPSLQQLQGCMTEVEELRQKAGFMERYMKKSDSGGNLSDIDIEWEQDCGICMENNTKIVLPNCNHSMCLKCFRDWLRFWRLLSLQSIFNGNFGPG
ncbi:hypothetical protein KP509_03G087400 [Ceratopteris richardii]|uniref:Zinc finger C3HC4 RING-type domain-containing protein n=1 Tax=Ceratopteris richardii TaxID=49495 RepID=A0A8T2V9P7_CERRI|nr:hypothetical protein KP509_03G087400 [Ceratopteris richardii]